MPQRTLFLWFCFLVLAIGCQKEAPPGATPVAPRQTAAKLLILVVDDAQLAAGLKILRGEWAERTGGQLEVQEWSVDQLLAASELSADLIIFPSRYVGTLVDRNWLRQVRKSVLENSDLALEDVFPLVRNFSLRYGNRVYGLTLGEPPLMLASRADELEISDQRLTWEKTPLRQPIESAQLDYPQAAELLARGIAFASHRGQTTRWFDVESMQPRLVSQPFEKALQQMLENSKSRGKLADRRMTLALPSSSQSDFPTFVELPRAGQIYDPLRETWEKNASEDRQVVFLGFAGRSVSVTRATRNSASAFKLLTWIASESIATQLSPRSRATSWFRKSQVKQARKWLSGGVSDDKTAALVTALLSSEHCYLLPRIPGVDDYLQSLEAAIAKAISEQLPAEKVLSEVRDQWNAVTNHYGRDRQRVAYRKHLGLNDQ